jgi:hypothetical protein
MGDYDRIGKELLRRAARTLYHDAGPSVCFEFGPGAGGAHIDGTVAGLVAVEVESRTPKQFRGALLDLILHPYPKKLLLLLDAYIGNRDIAVKQACAILGRFLEPTAFRVLVIGADNLEAATGAIRTALSELGVPIDDTAATA